MKRSSAYKILGLRSHVDEEEIHRKHLARTQFVKANFSGQDLLRKLKDLDEALETLIPSEKENEGTPILQIEPKEISTPPPIKEKAPPKKSKRRWKKPSLNWKIPPFTKQVKRYVVIACAGALLMLTLALVFSGSDVVSPDHDRTKTNHTVNLNENSEIDASGIEKDSSPPRAPVDADKCINESDFPILIENLLAELSQAIAIIGSKNVPDSIRNQAIDETIERIFLDENRTVSAIMSARNPIDKRDFKSIREFLEFVRDNKKYKKITIESYEIKILTDLMYDESNKQLSLKISFNQKYRGGIPVGQWNGERGEEMIVEYEDITRKEAEIYLRKYDCQLPNDNAVYVDGCCAVRIGSIEAKAMVDAIP